MVMPLDSSRKRRGWISSNTRSRQVWEYSIGLVVQGEPDFFEDPLIGFQLAACLECFAGLPCSHSTQCPGGMAAYQRIIVVESSLESCERRGVAPIAEGDGDVAQESGALAAGERCVAVTIGELILTDAHQLY